MGDIPERRHDVQLLNDTIHSIKAPGRGETFPSKMLGGSEVHRAMNRRAARCPNLRFTFPIDEHVLF